MIPRKIINLGKQEKGEKKEKIDAATTEVPTLKWVYEIDRQWSLQYLNDQRYSYEQRLAQMARQFEDEPDAWRHEAFIKAKHWKLQAQNWNQKWRDEGSENMEIFEDTKLGDEWYIGRQRVYTQKNSFRIAHGADLESLIIWTSQLDIKKDGEDLVFLPTGEQALFLMAYTKWWSLHIPSETGNADIWMYGGDTPEIILFSLEKWAHIQESNLSSVSSAVTLQTKNLRWEDNTNMIHLIWNDLASLRSWKKHRLSLLHHEDLSSPIDDAYLLYHSKHASDNMEERSSLQNTYHRARDFSQIFYRWDDHDIYKVTSWSWKHRMIKKLSPKTKKWKTTLDFTIPASLAGEDSYFSLALLDSNGYRYTLPFRVLPDLSSVTWRDEQETPAWQHYQEGSSHIYPRMIRKITFPRPFEQKEIKHAFDSLYGEGKVKVSPGEYFYDYGENTSVENKKWYTSFTLAYYFNPDTHRDDLITAKDIYGDLYSWKQSFNVEDIPLYHRKASIQWSLLNLLPADGYRGKHIQVIESNIPMMDVKFIPCTIQTDIPWDGNNQYNETLELSLFHCDENQAIEKSYDLSGEAEWWKEREHTIDLPDELTSVSAFRVDIQNQLLKWWDWGIYHQAYFYKTDVGLYNKVDDQYIYVWARDLMKGKTINTGTIELISSSWKKQTFPLTKDTVRIPLDHISWDRALIKFIPNTGDLSESFAVISPERKSYVSSQGQIHAKVDSRQLYQSQPRYRSSDDRMEKIYGYTDRDLYAPWDTIHFAWFAREMSKLWRDNQDDVSVDVVLSSMMDDEPLDEVQALKVDDFWWFQGSFTLWKEAKLGTYIVQYTIQPWDVSYEHTVLVKEYTKPNYEINHDVLTGDGLAITIDPRYYFGAALDEYELEVQATLIPKKTCRYCWRYAKKQDGMYNNFQFTEAPSDRTNAALTAQQGPVTLSLRKRDEIPDLTANYDLLVDMTVIDPKTGERQSKQVRETIAPSVTLWLPWSPITWMYDRKDTEPLKVSLSWASDKVHEIQASRYYEAYGHDTELGVDGKVYTIADHEMSLLSRKKIKNKIDYPDMQRSWTYFLRVEAMDKDENILARVEKRVEYYHDRWISNYYGNIQNNSLWHVQWPDNAVLVGEDITLDVNPYIPGNEVIVTVERGNRLLDVYERRLDGWAITIPAKQNYSPNVHISVHTVIGEEQGFVEKRKEPRLLHGYTEVEVEREDTKMNIQLAMRKKKWEIEQQNAGKMKNERWTLPTVETYEPGDTVTLDIETTDYVWNPLDARVSVAVIDKALLDLYHVIKEPIPYFFNKMGMRVGTYTNMRYLYQMLRVFVADGDKWWWGSGVASRFGQRRDDFLDVAFWQADVYTKEGKAQVDFTLPDNLTTRVVDTIAISTGTHLGTQEISFRVDKPVKLTTYLPQYLTLGDAITIPVTAEGRSWNTHEDLQVEGVMMFRGQKKNMTFVPAQDNNKKRYTVVHVPQDVTDAEMLQLAIAVREKTNTEEYLDSIKQEIPVRTQWFVQRRTILWLDTQGSIDFSLSGGVSQGISTITISPLPIMSWRRAFDYLSSYIYGCAEQRMSKLLPLLVLPDVEHLGVIDENILFDWKVKTITHEGKIWRQDREVMLDQGFDALLQFQNPDGWFSYRTSPQRSSHYRLSSYIYGGLLLAKSYGQDIPDTVIENLEFYLLSVPDYLDRDTMYLFMAWHRARAGYTGDISADLQQTIDNTYQDTIDGVLGDEAFFKKVLVFSVLSLQGDAIRAEQIMNNIERNHLSYPHPYNGVYLNDITLQAIALQWLLHIEKEVDSSEQIANDLLLSLLKKQDGEGLRWWSTQTNIQVFLALNEMMKMRGFEKKDAAISCDIIHHGEKISLKIAPWEEMKHHQKDLDPAMKDISSSWSCDQFVIVDNTIERLPQDIHDIVPYSSSIDILENNWKAKNTDPLGSLVDMETSFAIDQDAEQIAVEFYLPSAYRFVATVSAEWVGSEHMPFEIEWEYACRPDHFEVRYDRLFLYYDQLDAGVRCDIHIETIKSLSGKSRVMPSRLFEMYRTRVQGNTIPQEIMSS